MSLSDFSVLPVTGQEERERERERARERERGGGGEGEREGERERRERGRERGRERREGEREGERNKIELNLKYQSTRVPRTSKKCRPNALASSPTSKALAKDVIPRPSTLLMSLSVLQEVTIAHARNA